MLYGNDTGYFPEETWKHLQQSTLDLVSLDCTTLMHKEGTNHMGIADVLEVQARMLDSGIASDKTQFVATHFSHNGVLLHEEAEAQLVPHGFVVAYDGMVVSF